MINNSKLIFHFWLPQTMTEEQRKMYNFHLACLRYFSHVFESAYFMIACNDLNDTENIKKTICDIYDLGFKKIEIEVGENNEYFEAPTFYNKVALNIEHSDNIVFFGHNKGMTNVVNYEFEKHEPIRRLTALSYFMNLCNEQEIKDAFIHNHKITKGTLLLNGDFIKNHHNWMYGYTFQWINLPALRNYMEYNKISLPHFDNRLYGEEFLGNVLPFDFDKTVETYCYRYHTTWLVEDHVNEICEFLCDDRYGEFNEFYKKICSNI